MANEFNVDPRLQSSGPVIRENAGSWTRKHSGRPHGPNNNTRLSPGSDYSGLGRPHGPNNNTRLSPGSEYSGLGSDYSGLGRPHGPNNNTRLSPGSDYDNSESVNRFVNRSINNNYVPVFNDYAPSATTYSGKSSWLSGPFTQPNNFNLGFSPSGADDMDDLSARMQQHRAAINKKALTGNNRQTRAVYEKFFTRELDQASKREWWGNDPDETDYYAPDA